MLDLGDDGKKVPSAPEQEDLSFLRGNSNESAVPWRRVDAANVNDRNGNAADWALNNQLCSVNRYSPRDRHICEPCDADAEDARYPPHQSLPL